MKVIFGMILIIGLGSFNYSQRSTASGYVSKNDTALIYKYQKLLINATGIEKEFLLQLINTIRKFESKALDTTILQVAHFDSENVEDTLRSRIYEERDNIYVTSEWRMNGVLLWSKTVKNPYTWIGESTLFQYDTRDKWVIFTIGIYQALPEIQNIKGNEDLLEMAVENGLENLKTIGISTSREDYKTYLLKL
jgi:hypothetical protein